MKADFNIDYTEMKKEEKPHVLAHLVRSHIADNCLNHLRIVTGGAGFLIPEFKTGGTKKLLLRKRNVYIYCRIICTLNDFMIYIVNLPLVLLNILFLFGLKGVLYSH